MAFKQRQSIGQGWFEMEDANGRVYYANKHTKQASWSKPNLDADPGVECEATGQLQKNSEASGERQPTRMNPSESTGADAPIHASDEALSSSQAPKREQPAKRGLADEPRRRRQSEKPSAGSGSAQGHALNVSDSLAAPPRVRKGKRNSSAHIEDPLPPPPRPSAEAADGDDDFEEDMPTSFALQRKAKGTTKSLASMLEDAISAQSDGISDRQIAAMRQYFQDLDHLSKRPDHDAADSVVHSRSVDPVMVQPLLPELNVGASATANQAAPRENALNAGNVEPDVNVAFRRQPVAALNQIVIDVHISGASGPFADIVNGVFEPTSQQCCGMTLYRKRDDGDKWLEYNNSADRWNVLDTAHRGQCWGWAFLSTHRSLEKCKGLAGWKIVDGAGNVEDPYIRVNVVERTLPPSTSSVELNKRGPVYAPGVSNTSKGASLGALFPSVPLPPTNSAIEVAAKDSSPHNLESSQSLPQSHALSIIEQLERTLVAHPAAGDAGASRIQNALDDASLDFYHRNMWAIVRMQAIYRGRRERIKLKVRQRRMSAFAQSMAVLAEQEKTGLPAVDHVLPAAESSSGTPVAGAKLNKALGHRGSLSPTTMFHPVHNSSSVNRSFIDAIVESGVHSDDVDLNQLLHILKKSKLFKNRKIGEKLVPYAAICCELVDFGVVNFKCDTREQAMKIFQKLVDSQHLELLFGATVFKDEHSLIIIPQKNGSASRSRSISLMPNDDFSLVVESIWRDNNMRIACSIISDIINNREQRTSYEGWRSKLFDIAYNKGLRAVMFGFLLAHLGLGFYMTRSINFEGECRNHLSEISRASTVLYLESFVCSLYVLYLSARAIAGVPKTLTRWFIFEFGLILAMWTDLCLALSTFDGTHAPIRFSLPLRALMIACWSNRLRTHFREIYLSVRKLKVLGGAVLLWIIIMATLVTIYVRLVCPDATESVCQQLSNTYFDNAATAMVSLAVMMTTSNYGTISQLFLNRPGQSTYSLFGIFIALVIYMVVSYFLLLSMMLAIVFDAFKKGKKTIMSGKADVFDTALIGAFSLLCDRDSMSIKNDTYRRFMRLLMPNISTERIKKYWEFLDADKSGAIEVEEFLELSTILSFQVKSVSPIRIKLLRFFESLGRFGTGTAFFNNIITSKYFIYVAEGVVVANILSVFVSNILDAQPDNYQHPLQGYAASMSICKSIASQSSSSSCQGQVILDIIEFIFFTFYSMELILRWFAKGLQWIMDPWIMFDSAIVFLATASYIISFASTSSAIDPSISVVFRMLRIVRIVRLFRMSRNLNAFIKTISSIIPGVLSFLCLVLIFVNCYAGLGMLIFQCTDTNQDSTFVNNVVDFDTMTGAFIVLFQILSTSDWDSFLWQIRAVKPEIFAGSAVYFLSFYIFIVLLLTNILVSLIIESYGVNLEIIQSGLISDAVQVKDEGQLLMRYNQTKVIDAKIASFDRQAHRESSQAFQAQKEQLKLMKMDRASVPSDAKGTPARRKRGYTTVLASTRIQRSISMTESLASDAVLPPIQGDELPILVLNPSPDLAPQPQPASAHEHPALAASSDVSLRSASPPTLFSNLKNPYLTSSSTSSPALSSTRRINQNSTSGGVYSVRWKMNAVDILLMLRRASGLIKDVKHRFTYHRNVIIGSELVSFLVSRRLCSTRNDAVDLCNHMVMDDILQHEFQEHIFKDKYLFYVISPDAESNAYATGFIDDSDDDDDDEMLSSGAKRSSLPGFARSPSIGHSLLAKSLMRQSIAGKFNGNRDYLNDASLQDDLVAEAAADRYLEEDDTSEDGGSTGGGGVQDMNVFEGDLNASADDPESAADSPAPEGVASFGAQAPGTLSSTARKSLFMQLEQSMRPKVAPHHRQSAQSSALAVPRSSSSDGDSDEEFNGVISMSDARQQHQSVKPAHEVTTLPLPPMPLHHVHPHSAAPSRLSTRLA